MFIHIRLSQERGFLSSLLQPLAHDSAIIYCGNEANHVDQARHAMQTPESLVKGHHFLGVRSGVVAPLSITGFCRCLSITAHEKDC